MLKRFLTFLFCAVMFLPGLAAQERNAYGAVKAEPNVHLSMELTSKYMWRGIEYGTSPVVFPTLSYGKGGFAAYAMGGYATNGSHSEVDLGLSYTWKEFTLAFNDYYYPTAVGEGDRYFNFKSHETGHWMEATLGWAPEKLPLWVLVSTYIGGADKNLEGKQAFSSYAEVGTYYDFLDDHRLSLAVGAALNKSFYTDYAHGLNVVNIDLRYTYNAKIGEWTLPLSAAWIINPFREKSYLTFSALISF